MYNSNLATLPTLSNKKRKSPYYFDAPNPKRQNYEAPTSDCRKVLHPISSSRFNQDQYPNPDHDKRDFRKSNHHQKSFYQNASYNRALRPETRPTWHHNQSHFHHQEPLTQNQCPNFSRISSINQYNDLQLNGWFTHQGHTKKFNTPVSNQIYPFNDAACNVAVATTRTVHTSKQQMINLPQKSAESTSLLVQKLIKNGLIPLNNPEKKEEKPKQEISFDNPGSLKLKNQDMVSKLSTGTPCSSCGLRFPQKSNMEYQHHLDWHFRQNRKAKEAKNQPKSRGWYFSSSDWVHYEEVPDVQEDKGKSFFDLKKKQDKMEEPELPSVPSGTVENAKCQVCEENFSNFFNDEQEQWYLRPAISFEGKNYHPICLEDHNKSLKKSKSKDVEHSDSKAYHDFNNKKNQLINLLMTPDLTVVFR